MLLRFQEEKVTFNVFETVHHHNENFQCYRVNIVEEVSPSDSPFLPIEYVMVNYIDIVEKVHYKEVKEYVNFVSKSEALSNPRPRVLVSTEAQKSNIVEMKKLPPHMKRVFL